MRIFKFPFDPRDTVELTMPRGAEILHCGFQESTRQWCCWAKVLETAAPVTRLIDMIGTGHPIDSPLGPFINTDVSHGGALVFHFFEHPEIVGRY